MDGPDGTYRLLRRAVELVQEAELGAISGIVTAAYLLTPHLPMLYADYRATPMPGRLFHPAHRARFRFGAVTLRPAMTVPEIAATPRPRFV